jgi:hypothetical protein
LTLLAFGILGVVAERLWRDEATALNGLSGDLAGFALMPFRDRRTAPSSP